MSAPQRSKVAGFKPVISPPPQTAPPASDASTEQLAAVHDRLASWVTDLTTLQELAERLSGTATLDDALRETLRAGATLVGAQRGLVALEPVDSESPERTIGLGLGRADIGELETVPRSSSSYARILDGLPSLPEPTDGTRPRDCATVSGTGTLTDAFGDDGDLTPGRGEHRGYPEITHPDIATDDTLDPRHREVAARLGYAASYATRIATAESPRIGAAVWLYDEPAEPTARQRHLLGLYLRCASEQISRHLELARTRAELSALREGLLPSRLPRVPGVAMAVRHLTGPGGGGDWYDALPLPEGALGLSVGGVTGSGSGTVAAMGRLRASLRAYAVMEGEDPVAVLSDLELLLRLTEPARSATALFAYAEPSVRRILLAGAGHCPPLIVGEHRTEYVETTLSAPLGMLACWEAPSVELSLYEGETLLLYSDGLLHRTGEEMDRAFARLHSAAACAPAAVRADPEALVDHVLRTALPAGSSGTSGTSGSSAGEGAAPAAAGAPGAYGHAGHQGRTGNPGHPGNTSAAGAAGAVTEDVVLLAARF
ncbi:PP2C family protein-serine/threonine phosphatase [Streptomyces marispadix]|uniref:Serine/threonine-protein phosphatase n=1 Tax=Streptomyces marispadix TaxID=2922868 RepID=A0ABS9SZB4_9ACTN|nr:PP2C family protein-serine/threonine phosphatase [Streptomyces marispadix]MCH6161548.1 serine/threonine-protein phosphatase [Streptomyces marispadix]